MNYEDLSSALSLYTLMKATLLFLFINVVTRNMSVSIDGILILDRNPKVYEVDENIYTKLELNPQMLLTSNKSKSI